MFAVIYLNDLVRGFMAFDKETYDVVLIETPSMYVIERYDQPPFPDIGTAYIGNYLEQHSGISVAIIDAKLSRYDINQTIEKALELQPKIVGISSMTHLVKTAARISDSLKKHLPELTTVLGGYHATFLPGETVNEFPTFDFICAGEGEIAFNELCEKILKHDKNIYDIKGMWNITNGIVKDNGRGEIPKTLDELGVPGWHLFDQDIMKRYTTEFPLMTMRGCPFSCNFCSRPYGQIVRKRTPKLIVDEIENNLKSYNVEYIEFWDETFTVNKEHTRLICEEIISRNLTIKWRCQTHANTLNKEIVALMKRAGCVLGAFGVESGNDEILANMGKGASKKRIINARNFFKDAGITTCSFFIFGHPNETINSIWDTIKFATKLDCEETAIGIMVPYPGTEIYDMAKKGENGYVKMSFDWDDYNKQLGNAVELVTISRRKIELMQLSAYFWLYIVNGRLKDIYRMIKVSGNHNIWRLVFSIILKIIFPKSSKRFFKKKSLTSPVPGERHQLDYNNC